MNCGRNLLKAYICTDCQSTFHRNCGKFFKLKESDQLVQICLLCQQLPDFVVNHPNLRRPRSGSQSSTVSKNSKITSGSSNSDSEDESNVTEPTLKDVMTCSTSTNKAVTKLTADFKEFMLKSQESNAVQASHSTTLKKHDEKFRYIEANTPHELSFAGHLESENPEADLKQIVINIAKFLGVQITASDIRKTRLLKTKNGVGKSGPAPIVATFYSYSDCNKILDAKKDIKIVNSNVIESSTSTNRIYINQMLSQEMFSLLKKCKQWAVANKYKFVWHHQGEILIKKADKETPIRIKTEDDLIKLNNGQLSNITVTTAVSNLCTSARTSNINSSTESTT